jgi:hypothetical protein
MSQEVFGKEQTTRDTDSNAIGGDRARRGERVSAEPDFHGMRSMDPL